MMGAVAATTCSRFSCAPHGGRAAIREVRALGPHSVVSNYRVLVVVSRRRPSGTLSTVLRIENSVENPAARASARGGVRGHSLSCFSYPEKKLEQPRAVRGLRCRLASATRRVLGYDDMGCPKPSWASASRLSAHS